MQDDVFSINATTVQRLIDEAQLLECHTRCNSCVHHGFHYEQADLSFPRPYSLRTSLLMNYQKDVEYIVNGADDAAIRRQVHSSHLANQPKLNENENMYRYTHDMAIVSEIYVMYNQNQSSLLHFKEVCVGGATD